MARIPIDKKRGWLVSSVEFALEIWVHYCAVWSWVGPFHNPKKVNGRLYLVQNNVAHDVCWVVMFIFPIFTLLCVLPTTNPLFAIGILSVAFWRLVDLFMNALRGAIFGYKNRPELKEQMTIHRAQRRLLLTLMFISEVTFFNAIVFWILKANFGAKYIMDLNTPVDALQLSFSTISTVGYGTYAPADRFTIILALLEFVTGLLFIAGSIAQMSALLKTGSTGTGTKDETEGKEVSSLEVQLRRVLPPIMTLGFIGIAFWLCWAHRSVA